MSGGRYLTAKDVARRLGASDRFVRRSLLATGEMRAFRVGTSWRVRPSDYDAWVQARVEGMRNPVLVPVESRSGRDWRMTRLGLE